MASRVHVEPASMICQCLTNLALNFVAVFALSTPASVAPALLVTLVPVSPRLRRSVQLAPSVHLAQRHAATAVRAMRALLARLPLHQPRRSVPSADSARLEKLLAAAVDRCRRPGTTVCRAQRQRQVSCVLLVHSVLAVASRVVTAARAMHALLDRHRPHLRLRYVLPASSVHLARRRAATAALVTSVRRQAQRTAPCRCVARARSAPVARLRAAPVMQGTRVLPRRRARVRRRRCVLPAASVLLVRRRAVTAARATRVRLVRRPPSRQRRFVLLARSVRPARPCVPRALETPSVALAHHRVCSAAWVRRADQCKCARACQWLAHHW
jgi:hypothetical protein